MAGTYWDWKRQSKSSTVAVVKLTPVNVIDIVSLLGEGEKHKKKEKGQSVKMVRSLNSRREGLHQLANLTYGTKWEMLRGATCINAGLAL